MTSLRVALIDGPTYAPLYDVIPAFTAQAGIEVEIVARLPHAQLNTLVQAEMDREHLPFDLISTHIKYAPSQASALLPLDDLLTEEEKAAFLPAPLAQCRFRGELIQLPRHTDTRLLVYRRDWFDDPVAQEAFAARQGRLLTVPGTWAELAEVAAILTTPPERFGFAFTGQPSGLFGAFYELLSSAGGALFDGAGNPDLTSDAAHWALGYLRDLHVTHRVTPAATLDWEFADVTAAFMRGEVAMIGDWPGSFGLIGDSGRSAVADRFDVALYPLGPAGLRRVYSGSHSFALTRSCRDTPAALALLRTLTGVDAQLIEGRRGAVPTRRDATDILQAEAVTSAERHRRALLTETIATSMLSFPPLATYPLLEEAVWPLLDAALRDRLPVPEALAIAQSRIASDSRMTL